MATSDDFISLSREAQFAAQSLALGVTALGNASYAQTANYAQMLFSLSIGLERSAKLVLCLDYVARHGRYPSGGHVRRYGHDIQRLLGKVDGIGATMTGTHWNSRLSRSPITVNIIQVLSDFANNITRYYNIDAITGGRSSKSYDPVTAWHHLVSTLVLREHLTERRRAKIESDSRELSKVLEAYVSVVHSHEDRTPITDVLSASTRTALGDVEKPYTRMYVLQVCRFVATVIVGVATKARLRLSQTSGNGINEVDLPDMGEIFRIFFCDDPPLFTSGLEAG